MSCAQVKQPWHGNRESVFAAMRAMSERNEQLWAEARRLGPRYGATSIGSADFDYTLKAAVGDEYLRTLRRGGTPEEAFEAATAAGRECVQKWNENGSKGRASVVGRYELRRSPDAGDSVALGVHLSFKRAVE